MRAPRAARPRRGSPRSRRRGLRRRAELSSRPYRPDARALPRRRRRGGGGSLADLPWWDVFDDRCCRRSCARRSRTASTRGSRPRGSRRRARSTEARAGTCCPASATRAGSSGSARTSVTNPAARPSTRSTAVLFSWELDLWGRLRRPTEVARAQYLASEEARRGVLLSLVSDVASAYFELRELDEDLAIARRTTAAFQETHDLFRRRLEGGAASALETARAEALLGSVSAQIPEIERAIVAKETELNFLLGRNPQPILRDGPLAALPPPVARRPALGAARAAARRARGGAAPRRRERGHRRRQRGLLPAAQPHGRLRQREPRARRALLAGASPGASRRACSVRSSRPGRIKGNYRASQARYEQAKVRYQATVAASFGEVSSALADPREAAEAEARSDAGRPRVPRGGAPREPALHVRALRVLRGAGRAAAALPRRARRWRRRAATRSWRS